MTSSINSFNTASTLEVNGKVYRYYAITGGELAGHDHWVAGAAIGLAGLAAIWGVLKGKKADKEAEPEEELEEEAA